MLNVIRHGVRTVLPYLISSVVMIFRNLKAVLLYCLTYTLFVLGVIPQ